MKSRIFLLIIVLLVYFTQQIYNIIQNSTKYTPIVFPNTQQRSESI